jgi:hypothetical protein
MGRIGVYVLIYVVFSLMLYLHGGNGKNKFHVKIPFELSTNIIPPRGLSVYNFHYYLSLNLNWTLICENQEHGFGGISNLYHLSTQNYQN